MDEISSSAWRLFARQLLAKSRIACQDPSSANPRVTPSESGLLTLDPTPLHTHEGCNRQARQPSLRRHSARGLFFETLLDS
jgi:hypothetical protein